MIEKDADNESQDVIARLDPRSAHADPDADADALLDEARGKGMRAASELATPPGTSSRRLGRVIAVQALYEIDAVGADAQTSVAALADEHDAPERARTFAVDLVQGVLGHQPAIDEVIQRTAPQWPLPQVAAVDRAILRLAVFELRHARETPSKVAINEAVDLAKEYGSESSGRFINGVLGHVATLPDGA